MSESHTLLFHTKGQFASAKESGPTSSPKPDSHLNTRANKKKRMDQFEPENIELHEEVTTLRAELEKLSNLISLLAVTQSQPLLSSVQAQTVVSATLISTVLVSTPQHTMPEGRP